MLIALVLVGHGPFEIINHPPGLHRVALEENQDKKSHSMSSGEDYSCPDCPTQRTSDTALNETTIEQKNADFDESGADQI